ncbi:NWD1 [Branchiostoma lanceolatum]|uniref:NWD1 protein n=1 Tax=Branchiostoma lanceolatum TaxID=7740 RepID=A0A8J9Z2C1_BRALA|nr:NWD1 [Branchiostoma lanceolatum]
MDRDQQHISLPPISKQVASSRSPPRRSPGQDAVSPGRKPADHGVGVRKDGAHAEQDEIAGENLRKNHGRKVKKKTESLVTSHLRKRLTIRHNRRLLEMFGDLLDSEGEGDNVGDSLPEERVSFIIRQGETIAEDPSPFNKYTDTGERVEIVRPSSAIRLSPISPPTTPPLTKADLNLPAANGLDNDILVESVSGSSVGSVGEGSQATVGSDTPNGDSRKDSESGSRDGHIPHSVDISLPHDADSRLSPEQSLSTLAQVKSVGFQDSGVGSLTLSSPGNSTVVTDTDADRPAIVVGVDDQNPVQDAMATESYDGDVEEDDEEVDRELQQLDYKGDTRVMSSLSLAEPDDRLLPSVSPVPTPWPSGEEEDGLRLAQLELPERMDQVLHGNVHVQCRVQPKTIKVYISASSEDTVHERDTLATKAYPQLKQYYKDRGYELQVVDLRWGFEDMLADDHSEIELCLKEIESCQGMVTKPYFVTFFSQKYGPCIVPAAIPKEEYEALNTAILGKRDKVLSMGRFSRRSLGENIYDDELQKLDGITEVSVDKGDTQVGTDLNMKSTLGVTSSDSSPKKPENGTKVRRKSFQTGGISRRESAVSLTDVKEQLDEDMLSTIASPILDEDSPKKSDSITTSGKIVTKLARKSLPNGGISRKNSMASVVDVKEEQVEETSETGNVNMSEMKTTHDFDLDLALLAQWYKLDENMDPPVYRLQPISSQYRDFNKTTDRSRRQQAIGNWKSVHQRLQKVLQDYAPRTGFSEETMRKYFTSVVDLEVQHGLSRNAPEDGFIWFKRRIVDMESHISDAAMRTFTDMHHVRPELDEAATQRRRELEDMLESQIPLPNIHEYTLSWTYGGINPIKNRGHAIYVDKLCQDFSKILTASIDASLAQQGTREDEKTMLFEATAQHVSFCQDRAATFFGRKRTLGQIKSYLRSGSRRPLVVHGASGTGKTSLLAKAIMQTTDWMSCGDSAVIVRLIGLTSESRNIRSLLRSLCLQLTCIYGGDMTMIPHDYMSLVNFFVVQLECASADKPLVVFLDALDQLTDDYNARQLFWLPKELPPYVHIVVSTTPQRKYDCFPALKETVPDDQQYVEVPDLPEADAAAILDHWLKADKRRLTSEQLAKIIDSFRQCPNPLFLKMAYNESTLWNSYTPTSELRLATCVEKLANQIFARHERDHGEAVVRRTLGYITAAKHGVTFNELEDILSLDEDVMNCVTVYNTLSVRRFPPYLLRRLLADLSSSLLVTHSNGTEIYRWFHQLFTNAATERYLLNRDRAPSYHTIMAEYFLGKWSNGTKKPCSGHPKGLDRMAADMSLSREVLSVRGTKAINFNIRKLMEMPCHLLESNKMALLKSEVLCNYEWLLAKIRAVGLRAVLEDHHDSLKVNSDDEELRLLSETLQLSSEVLKADALQLATQLIGRLHDIIMNDKPLAPGDPKKYPQLGVLLHQASHGSIPAFVPSMTCLTPPGGVLFDLLEGHTDKLTALAATTDGFRAVTASMDESIKFWDLKTGKVVKTIDGVGSDVRSLTLCMNNSYVVTTEVSCIRVWSLNSGQVVLKIDQYVDPAIITTAAEGQLLVAFFDGSNEMRVWDLKSHKMIKEVSIGDDEAGSLHKDRSILVSRNCHGDQVLYAYRSRDVAYVQNARTGKMKRRFVAQGDGASIHAVAMAREYWIVACRYQYMKLHEIYHLELYDVLNGAFIRSIKGCAHDIITDLHVNRLGSHAISLCVSESNNTTDIAVWNLETEDHKHLAKHANLSTMGTGVELRYCLTASPNECVLRVWNLSQHINVQQAGQSRKKKKEGILETVPMKDFPRYVVARSMNNGPITVWNVAKGKRTGTLVRIERGLVESTDCVIIRNTKIYILSDRGISHLSDEGRPVFQTIYIYDLQTKKFDKKITGLYIVPSPQHEYTIIDNNLLGLSENRSHIIAWSLDTGMVVYRLRANFRKQETSPANQTRQGVPTIVRERELEKSRQLEREKERDKARRRTKYTEASMTPWERRNETKTAKVRRYDRDAMLEQQRLEEMRKEKENGIEQYMVSADERIIVCSYFAHHLAVFDVENRTHVHTLENEHSMLYLHNAAMTVNGSHLAHANYDEISKSSYITVWDLQTGKVRKRLKNEPNVCCVGITDNAERVIFGTEMNVLKIWCPFNKRNNKKIVGYKGLSLGVGSKIAIVENGSRVVLFAQDISLWDLESGSVLSVFTPDMRIQTCNVAMNGKLIVFGMRDSSSLVTLQLKSGDIGQAPPVEMEGTDIFGEAPTSSSDEESEEEEDDE